MVKLFKEDDVSVSFHYLFRKIRNKDGEIEEPLTKEEFETVFLDLRDLRSTDIGDEEIESKIRFRQQVIIEKVEKYNENFISGIYKTSYWGHSFENTEKGEISAFSLNLRPFFFLLYLSKSGRIYIASQYLGSLGGFEALKDTIKYSFKKHTQVVARCINVSDDYIGKATPKEVQITYARKPDSITGKISYGSTGALAFKKIHKDDGFEEDVKTDFLSKRAWPKKDIRKGIAEILKKEKLLTADYDEIKGCKIILQVGSKGKKVIQLLDHKDFATKFNVDVNFNNDGHPDYQDLKKETIEILKTEVMSQNEND